MSEWRPIESAPKDGTKFLAFGLGHGNSVVAFQCREEPFPTQAIIWWGWIDDFDEVDVGGGLYKKVPKRFNEDWRGDVFGFKPTHWMPLPEPPK